MIDTERTILRSIELTDSEAVFAYRSDVETNKHQGWVPGSLDEVKAFTTRNPMTFNQIGTWFQLVIIEKESGTLIGDVGVHFIDQMQCELGCTISKTHQEKGYATEALKGVVQYLFSRLEKHRIVMSIDPRNTGAIQLAERLDFRKEAHFRQNMFVNGEWVDDLVYAMLNSDWN